jgi:hypothetical protein
MEKVCDCLSLLFFAYGIMGRARRIIKYCVGLEMIMDGNREINSTET